MVRQAWSGNERIPNNLALVVDSEHGGIHQCLSILYLDIRRCWKRNTWQDAERRSYRLHQISGLNQGN
jgi:hypothetical protein